MINNVGPCYIRINIFLLFHFVALIFNMLDICENHSHILINKSMFYFAFYFFSKCSTNKLTNACKYCVLFQVKWAKCFQILNQWHNVERASKHSLKRIKVVFCSLHLAFSFNTLERLWNDWIEAIQFCWMNINMKNNEIASMNVFSMANCYRLFNLTPVQFFILFIFSYYICWRVWWEI